MRFKWRTDSPLMYPNDTSEGFFRLPKYVVSFDPSQEEHRVNYGDGEWGA